MNQLPADASTDQSNVPDGHYRRNNGLIHELPENTIDKSPSLPEIDIDKLEGMTAQELQKLIRKVYKAGWGYGKLTGADLIKHALMTKDEAYEALKLTALTLATNASEWREFVALATFWAEREKGKPQQSVDVTGKIGIVEIVLEAGRQRQALLVDSNQLIEGNK